MTVVTLLSNSHNNSEGSIILSFFSDRESNAERLLNVTKEIYQREGRVRMNYLNEILVQLYDFLKTSGA